MRGKRAIYGGRKPVRHGLYMAALVAAHHNPILRNFYLRLRAAGIPAKLALTATMRKLLIVLISALKSVKLGNMSGIFPSCSEEDKRIRPGKPVIKGGIFPSTSR